MRKAALFAALSLLMLVAIGPVLAEKTIWIDEKGSIHSEVKDTRRGESERSDVELYVTSWCPYCKQAKQYFRSRGIPFTAYDIEKDATAARRKGELDTRGGVPFAVINGQKIRGFSPEAYEKALERGR
jgi:glutaredoxin-like YruB-family protein